MATHSDNSKLKRLREQAERLKAEIQAAEAKAKAQERKDRTRRMIILGGLADAVLEEGGAVADRLREIIAPELAKRVRSDQRRYVADLLVDDDSPSESPPSSEARPAEAAVATGADEGSPALASAAGNWGIATG
jgi:hypothetical protein